ncbi:hypothetical protein EC991_006538 [Linnemannia zychae]|nr:hypothetical protein EC991_006538 [Linnemannia zychae]
MTWNRDCVPDTLKVVNSGDTTEMSCTLKDQFHNRSNQHMFSTRLFVTPKGESNTYEINLPEKGKDTAVWSAPAGSVFEYGGSMDVANGTQRVAVYTKTTSWDEAANLSKKCMPDDAFCFQIYGSVCIFSTSGLEWERSCPLYKSISFAAQPTEGKTPVIRNLGTRFESHLTLTMRQMVAKNILRKGDIENETTLTCKIVFPFINKDNIFIGPLAFSDPLPHVEVEIDQESNVSSGSDPTPNTSSSKLSGGPKKKSHKKSTRGRSSWKSSKSKKTEVYRGKGRMDE